MKRTIVVSALCFALLAAACPAQTLPAGPPAPLAGPLPPVDPKALALLKLLQDRGGTLKDFTAAIDYSVRHPLTDETSGKRGSLDFIDDPNKGPIFLVDFKEDTDEDGKPVRKHPQQLVFDGVTLLTKDAIPKEFTRSNVLPAGAKPGDAVNLNGPLTLPIGLNVDDVIRNFEVTSLPTAGASPDRASLRLVPRAPGKFDFKKLDITIDPKLQLPVTLIQTAKNDDITTITLSKIEINTGKARVPETAPPKEAGWTEKK